MQQHFRIPLTPLKLYKFTKEEISGVTTFYVTTEHVKKVPHFVHSQFLTSPKFKGTHKKPSLHTSW